MVYLIQKKISILKNAFKMIKKYLDYEPDLEAAVLGIFLIEPHTFGACYGLISEECFHDIGHILVFKEIEKHWKGGGQIDLLTIAYLFHKKGVLQIGSLNVPSYLTTLTNGVVCSSHIESWCLFLRELAAKRLMVQVTTMGLNSENGVFENAEMIKSKLAKVMEIKSTNDWLDIKNVTQQLIDNMTSAQKTGGNGIKTGFKRIDDANGGFKPGNMLVIAARPGVGKSIMLGKLAKYMAYNNENVGIMSLEMPAVDVFTRMISSESGVPFWKIEKGLSNDASSQKLINDSLSKMAKLPIYFSDTAKVNSHDIRAKAEKLQRRHGLKILFIDYLQLIDSIDNKNKNRENIVADISRGIKLLAMDLKIPIVILAQLSRLAANAKPELHHLRESGAIEQDADGVIFIHKDEAEGTYELLVRKWRNGNGHIDIPMSFSGETMDFTDIGSEDLSQPTQTYDNPSAGIRRSITESNKEDNGLPF